VSEEHPHAQHIRAYLEAWNSGDADRCAEFYADDIVVHVPGDNQITGTHRGREAVTEVVRRIHHVTDGSHRAEADDVRVDGDRVVVVAPVTAEKGDKQLAVDLTLVYTLDDEGKVTEIRYLAHDHSRWDDFYQHSD
jgi:uncharacterized protein (TIGR02246 family)